MARDDVPRDDDLEARLGRLARATDDLSVDPRVADAVMARTSLEAVARATEVLAPTPALTDAVMARVTGGRRSQGAALARDVERTGPWAVAVAAVAAAAAVLLSFQAEQQLAGDVASTLEAAELVSSLESAP